MLKRAWEWVVKVDKAFFSPVYHIFFVGSITIGVIAFLPAVLGILVSIGRYLLNIISHIKEMDTESLSVGLGALCLILSLCLILQMLRMKRISSSLHNLDEYQRLKGRRISKLLVEFGAAPEKMKTEEQYGRLCDELLAFLRDTAADLSEILTALIGSRCHVSIKIFNPESDQITTWVRSSAGRIGQDADRNHVDETLPSYPPDQNTAFSDIMRKDKSYYYFSNFLKLRSVLGLYKNGNEKWKRLYGSTLVVPITTQCIPSKITADSIWGFLCVDSKQGKFDEKFSLPILLSFSRILENILEEVSPFGKGDPFHR